MSDSGLKNIALLIDADNTSPKGIDPVLTVMAELGQVKDTQSEAGAGVPAQGTGQMRLLRDVPMGTDPGIRLSALS